MKIVCLQDELARFLQITARALAVKSTLPILTGIFMETNGNILRCVATDLEIAIEVNVPNIQVFTNGSIVLPGKTFVEIIRHLPPGPVTIELDENSKMVTITSKHSNYQLPILPAEEFPTLPELKDGTQIEISGEDLREAIRQTIYATLADDPRPFLSSILWEVTTGRLRLVATDVNRLAVRDLKVNEDFQKTALVPVHSLREIANIFGSNNEEKLKIHITDKLIFIHGSGITFSSRLVEAQFPRYEQVVPKEFNGTVVINKDEFVAALERTALVSNSIKISISEKGMIITAKEPDKGRSYEEIPLDFTGIEIEIGFNGRFLLDFLKSVEDEKIIFKYNQDQKPTLLQAQGKDEYFYIVMPLKLSV
ncbi:MAG TPA: DNA polymerase III subunit beta [Firmicutes bacterium]|nr:DNA polymerase III subunit beta [Bacillota bacterium]